jgi:hypothetical protein
LSPSLARSSSHRLDISVGISGPHDFAVRLSRVRPARQSVHRIPPPTFVTIAKRPSDGRGMTRGLKDDLPDVTSENACGRLARRANQSRQRNPCQLHSNCCGPVDEASRHRRSPDLDVVPAHAGTHTPRLLLRQDARRLSANHGDRWLCRRAAGTTVWINNSATRRWCAVWRRRAHGP